MNSKSIAIIPARSGSKGLKNKNIKPLNGKPLLAYAISAAQEAGCFNTIHVSTDSEEYAKIAEEWGAEVPFLRSFSTAGDNASTWDAVKYVLSEYSKKEQNFDIVTVLQPTSPLRTAEDIQGAYRYFNNKHANMISSVCEMEHSPLWSNTLPEDCSMAEFEDEQLVFLPRQSLPVYYRENGAIYILKTEHLYQARNIYKDRCFAYIMPRLHSIDIDNALDFLIAETIMKANF